MSTMTVYLTGLAPVAIDPEAWPLLGQGEAHNAREFRADASREWIITARRHADGRTLVYGTFSSRWQGERDANAGEMVVGENLLIEAVRRVAETLGAPDRIVQEFAESLDPVPLV